MAHQSKFVSVNLNRSYGQPSPSFSVHGRPRPGSGGSGGSGGMVVLSRARSSASSGAKTAQKLAVPPPMNLPSLRKEHERFDPASSASAAGHGSLGLGSRVGPSASGWSKPALPMQSSLYEKAASGGGESLSRRTATNGDEIAGGSYMPPGARAGGQPINPARGQGSIEKAVILRGDDFPSLRATVTTALKQKEASSQRQKQKQGTEKPLGGREVVPESRASFQMRPQIKSSRLISSNVSDGDGGSILPLGSSEQSPKEDASLPGPLPLVRLQHTSEWTDDERDTGLSIRERERDRGILRLDSTQAHDPYDDRGLRGFEVSSVPSRDFYKGDSVGRDTEVARSENQDFGSWRFPLNPRDRVNTYLMGVDRDRHYAKPFSGSREMNVDGLNNHSSFGENGGDGFAKRSHDSRYDRMSLGSSENIQNAKVVAEAINGKSAELNAHGHYFDHLNHRFKGSSSNNATISKVPFSIGSKGTLVNDTPMNLSREKRSAATAGKPYLGDAEFHSKDSFLGDIGDTNVIVLKKKKDFEKHVDFQDPIRESFEAEVESILRMQEQGRQHAMEEQARALELARKEEEERERLVREEEERRRLLEEEAKEAAWRAEKERLDAMRQAEEQKLAREEEKKKYMMEEERRKEAARKKLLELEARIAKRQTEGKLKDDTIPSYAAASDEIMPRAVKERGAQRATRVGGWENGDNMVERITNSELSDSSSVDQVLDVVPRSQFPRNGIPSFLDRGNNSFGRKSVPSQAEEIAYQNPRQDTFGYRKGFFPKKQFHGDVETKSIKTASKVTTVEEPQIPDYRQPVKERWSSKGDYFKSNTDTDAEFIDSAKFEDDRMGSGNSYGSCHAPFSEISAENSVVDVVSSTSRNRQFLRQPRVPPPPVLPYVRRSSMENHVERSHLACFIDDEIHYSHSSRYEQKTLQTGYGTAFDQTLQQRGTIVFSDENASHSELETDKKMIQRCDSQLSLSVSSPPSSPALFSHHEMDVSRDSPPLPTSADCERTIVSDSEHVVLPLESGTVDRMITSRSVSPGADDEWPVANNEEIEEEVYYEEGDDYEDIAEVHEGDDENLDPVKEIEDLQSDQVILGFNEGVEVKLPSIDKFEITSSNSRKDYSSVILEEPINSRETIFQEGTMDDSLAIVSEVEKELEGLSLDQVRASSNSTDCVETSQSSGMPTQQTLIPGTSLSIISAPANSLSLSLPSAAVSQGEASTSLQFGLFSGPSLIPSPISAIQIGSIQMPIHLHTQLSPSLPQLHHSQPPLFQFGQLRYTPTISQSILPRASQSTSFVHSPLPASYSFNQNPTGCLCNQVSQNYSNRNQLQDGTGSSVKQSNMVQSNFGPSQVNFLCSQLNASLDPQKNVPITTQNQSDGLTLHEKRSANDSTSPGERHGHDNVTVKKSYRFIAKSKEFQPQQHTELHSSRFFSERKPPLNSPTALSRGRRKRYAYTIKNTSSRLSYPIVDAVEDDSSSFQRRARRNYRRTEFGVRSSIERKQAQGPESLSNTGKDKKMTEYSMSSGISVRDVGKKDATLNRPTKSTDELENGSADTYIPQFVSSDKKTEKTMVNGTSLKNITTFDKPYARRGYISDNIQEDGDASLLSGVVCVFKQTGIEVPSNEDDFIEVRSKRQMLNDRREQRAKENKSKSRMSKTPSKETTIAQNYTAKSNLNKVAISSDDGIPNIVCSNPLVGDGKGSSKVESSVVFTASQTLPPIGTPSVNVDSEIRSNELKYGSSQIVAALSVPDSGSILAQGPLENKNMNPDYSTTLPSSSWDTVNLNNQMITLTQTQLEEAMKPSQFGSHVPSIGLESHKSVSSAVTAEMPFSSCSSSISSLLAGEKIQFGAVMPPNILPIVSRAISKGFGHTDSSGSEMKVGRDLSNDYSMFFTKEKCPGEPCANLEDAEAEAEAAASAVAVAAITNDELVGSAIGTSSGAKSFNSVDGTSLTSGGVTSGQKVTGQSTSEESLTVALPADLSVDTPHYVWPALPSPQTSHPMLSQFTGIPPSQLPSFETNHLLDRCSFAYGPNDESASSQGQSQQTALGSGSPGTWAQYHSGVDSFYQPAAGFAGPFINPGGIPGVQCPPHMVFYNHFAPVGQFGQVGLGFMGTTYIPAGKQPEWKQTQVCPTIGDNNVDLSNTNVVSGQGTPTKTVQNLAPGPPLMAMAPPLTMFDVSPFQPTTNIPLQAWPHVPAPLHSIPLSMPLQQHQVESRVPSQFGWNQSGECASGNNRFAEPRPSMTAEISRNIPLPNFSAPEISDELSRVMQPTSSTAAVQASKPSDNITSGNEKKVPKTVVRPIGSNVNDNGGTSASSNGSSLAGNPTEIRGPTSSVQQQPHQDGYADQQHDTSQRTSYGSEWHPRRAGYHFRKQGSGSDKNIGPKMKQIYVVKPSTISNQGQMKT